MKHLYDSSGEVAVPNLKEKLNKAVQMGYKKELHTVCLLREGPLLILLQK